MLEGCLLPIIFQGLHASKSSTQSAHDVKRAPNRGFCDGLARARCKSTTHAASSSAGGCLLNSTRAQRTASASSPPTSAGLLARMCAARGLSPPSVRGSLPELCGRAWISSGHDRLPVAGTGDRLVIRIERRRRKDKQSDPARPWANAVSDRKDEKGWYAREDSNL